MQCFEHGSSCSPREYMQGLIKAEAKQTTDKAQTCFNLKPIKAKAKQAAKKAQTFFKNVAKKATAARAATTKWSISACCFKRHVRKSVCTLFVLHL